MSKETVNKKAYTHSAYELRTVCILICLNMCVVCVLCVCVLIYVLELMQFIIKFMLHSH